MSPELCSQWTGLAPELAPETTRGPEGQVAMKPAGAVEGAREEPSRSLDGCAQRTLPRAAERPAMRTP